MKGLFVTGTGTDIGKTYVSAAICRALTDKSLKLAYYKAAVSGADCIENSDAGFVRDNANIRQDTDRLLSYLYEKPLSPHLAARLENRFASLDKIKHDFLSLQSDYDYVLTEGAGGIICPIVYEKDRTLMYLDVLKAFNVRALIVADAGLGTINHTILTLSYLRSNNVDVAGVILNNFDKDSLMHKDNLYMVEQLGQIKVIATLAHGDTNLTLLDRNMEEYFNDISI